ncbi:MAG: CPBP family intramembrane glutamic endopeptidase [Gemmataceae bacterium]
MSSSVLSPRRPFNSHSSAPDAAPDREDDNVEDHATRATAAAFADPAVPRTRPPLGLVEAILWAAAFFVLHCIPPLILASSVCDEPDGRERFFACSPYAMLCGQIMALGFAVFALSARVGSNWTRTLNLRRPPLVPTLLAVLCLPAVFFLAAWLVHLATPAPDAAGPSEVATLAGSALWFGLLVHAVGPAVNEEVFFRGFLGRGLIGRYGVIPGVLLTSVLFGVFHANVPQAILGLVIGAFMHLAYLATRSLWVPMLLHFLTNALVHLMTRFASVTDEPPTAHEWVWFAVALALTAIPAGYGLYRYRVRDGATEGAA